MSKKPLPEDRKQECLRLKAIFNAKKSSLGLTQEKLAHVLEINQSSVSHYLNGINPLNPSIAAAFAQILDVDIGEFSERLALEAQRIAGAARPVERKENGNVIKADFKAPIRSTMIEVPYLDTAGSMGRGIQRKENDNVIDHIRIDRAYLKSLVSFSLAENLALITGYGDSMSPTFSDGDIMLVDRGVTEVKVDAVYVLAKKDEIFIKRLQRRSDGLFRMISDNKAYDSEDLTDMDLFEVLGRVIYVWAGSKL